MPSARSSAGGPDARQFQQLRRIDRTAREDHFAVGTHAVRPLASDVFNRTGPAALESDAGCERMGPHLEVGPAHGGSQVGVRGAASPAPAHRHVHAAKPFLLISIHIVGMRVTRLAGRRQPRRMQWIAEAAVSGLQLALSAAIFVAAFLPMFGAPEIRQNVAIRPTRRTRCAPSLEVLGVAADINQSVDGGRSTEHLAARGMHAAPIQVRLGLRVVEPIVLLHVHGDGQRRGHLNEDGAIRSSVFQQQHAASRVGAQAIRQHAAG